MSSQLHPANTPPSGTRVRLVDSTHNPPHELCGREGVTYRPSWEGTYVRFDDGSYVFAWWDEIEEASNQDRSQP